MAIMYLLIAPFDEAAFGLSDSNLKSNSLIKHVIVISQGKRSFDNYFGTFPGANGFPPNTAIPINPFPQPVTKFTISIWFNTNNSLPKTGFLINKGGIGIDTPGKNLNYGIWMNTKGNIIAGFETKNGTDYQVGSNGTFNDGVWHNAIVTYNGKSNLKLFLDGVMANDAPTTGAIPDTSDILPIRIGANSLKPEDFFAGYIDKISIWNRAMEYPEILGTYNNTIDTTGQILGLSFEGNNHQNKNKSAAVSTNVLDSSHTANSLRGIYLNGSMYQDLEPRSLQNKDYIKPFPLNESKTDSPDDSSKAYRTSYNHGRMDGFGIAQVTNGQDPKLAMGYYDAKFLPFYWHLASEFVLADNFFAPTMDSGLTNHQYLYTANSVDYQKNASFRGKIELNKTIFDEIQAAGYTWKVYVQDYNPALNYSNQDVSRNRYLNLLTAIPRFVDNKTLNSNIVDLVQYFRDLKGDNFPAVSYIVAPGSEESSPKDVSVGQEFVHTLVLALMKSQYWNDSAFIITYREPGGWYDHVAPPKTENQTYGFRVPTLLISPFAKTGYVDSTLYDVTSILKFIEYNYGLPPLSARDANANNLLNAFNFSQTAREPPAFHSASSQYTIQENEKTLERIEDSIKRVNLIYLVVLSTLPLAGIIIFRLSQIRQSKLSVSKTDKL
jgi:phospholipase C